MSDRRALIVDDEELARKNLQVMLNDYWPEVEVIGLAANIREAEEFIKSNSIDILFLDINAKWIRIRSA